MQHGRAELKIAPAALVCTCAAANFQKQIALHYRGIKKRRCTMPKGALGYNRCGGSHDGSAVSQPAKPRV